MPPKRTLARKRQTKINFSPSAKPSPKKHVRSVSSSSENDDENSPRPTKRRRLETDTGKKGKSGRPGKEVAIVLTGSSSEEGSRGEVQVIKARKAPKHVEPEEDAEGEIMPAPRLRKSCSKSKQPGRSVDKSEARKSRRAARQSATAASEDEEQAALSSKAHTHTTMAGDSDESDEVDLLPKRTRRQQGRRSPTPEEAQPKKGRGKVVRKAATPEQNHDHEEEEEEEEVEEEGDSYDEDDELKEELAFLKSSPVPDRGRLRSNHDKPKSEREKALEALKRRRGVTTEPSSSATPSRKKPVVIDSESDSELEVIREEEETDGNMEDDEEVEEEIEDDEEDDDEEHNTNAFTVFQENGEDEDFIDDDDALIGVPAEHTSIPLQFSSLGSAKPRELFKYAIEWMVHKKINPAFAADDEIYELAFRKLNDEVNGLANSKFHSSVWTPDFTRAIRARPDLIVNEIGHQMREVLEPHCEACNRKNHTATWEASLTGTPYNKDTLEPLADESDSDSGSGSDSDSSISSRASSADLNGEKATYDAQGERLPPESKFWTLGSTCKANAQVAHTLYHWRYHLNSWVVDYLISEGKCTPEKLVKRDKWSVKKRTKYANKIVDKMEKEGEVRKLHRLYKDQVDFALEAKNEYTRGWGRRG